MHVDSIDYGAAKLGVAVSDTPAGPFKYLKSFRPNNNQESRDMTIFVDEVGRPSKKNKGKMEGKGDAYVAYSSEMNKVLHISRLTGKRRERKRERERKERGRVFSFFHFSFFSGFFFRPRALARTRTRTRRTKRLTRALSLSRSQQQTPDDYLDLVPISKSNNYTRVAVREISRHFFSFFAFRFFFFSLSTKKEKKTHFFSLSL